MSKTNQTFSVFGDYIYGNIDEDGTMRYCGAVDEFNNPIKRTKQSHPYNYDGFIQWRGGANEEANGTIYSDRLLQWDWDKHNELCEKHFGDQGQYWSQRQPELIEAFLRDWTGDKNLKLIFIMEYCNQSSGYPVWRFDYSTSKRE